MSMLAPAPGVRAELVIDGQTGHQVEIGWQGDPLKGYLWGFRCCTCDKVFARLPVPGFDWMKAIGELIEDHAGEVE